MLGGLHCPVPGSACRLSLNTVTQLNSQLATISHLLIMAFKPFILLSYDSRFSAFDSPTIRREMPLFNHLSLGRLANSQKIKKLRMQNSSLVRHITSHIFKGGLSK